MNTLSFKIITQERVVYADEVVQATVPTRDGEITILPRHAPLVSILKAGVLTVVKDGQPLHLSVSSGFVEVRPGSELVILADTAERAEEVDLERAEAARKRAEEVLKAKDRMSVNQFIAAQAALEKELARVTVRRKYRPR